MKKSKIKSKKAFTLVEFIVSVAIITIISGVVFWNGREFNDKLEVTYAAQNLSLAVRQVQSYGTLVRETTSDSGQFDVGYGINIDMPNSTQFLFIDSNKNKIYDDNPATTPREEFLEDIVLKNNISIDSLCAVNSLSTPPLLCSIQSIQIIFIRPSLDAIITVIDNSGNIVPGPWISAHIGLISQQGASRTISVYSTGQISIQ